MDLRAELKKSSEKYPDQFPDIGSSNYYDRFKRIEDFLNDKIHPHVATAAALRGDGFLTDHGPEHIKTVISRACYLTSSDKCDLTPYEIYLLLTAIHFHDVGNIYGRKNHEKKCMEIMDEIGKLAGEDDPEKRIITRIAASHGGLIDGNKDTISHLPEKMTVLGKDLRVQLIAAILRFSDELAEDRNRAARYLDKLGQIPKKSQIYHKYAERLNSIVIRPIDKKIELEFDFYSEVAVKKYFKGRKKVFLLDEIFDRTLKMHLERIYCSRYMVPYVQIDKIKIIIQIFNDKSDMHPIHEIIYSLKERGYPTHPENEIYSLCDNDLKIENKFWTGQILKKLVEKGG